MESKYQRMEVASIQLFLGIFTFGSLHTHLFTPPCYIIIKLMALTETPGQRKETLWGSIHVSLYS